MVLAVWAVGLGGQATLGQDNLLQNGTFDTDLASWDTEGDVIGGDVIGKRDRAPFLSGGRRRHLCLRNTL